jgi:ribosomal-protein-alanine N-acetyltransferase
VGSIKVRQFVADDMKRLREIEKASIKFLTPLSSLLYFYDIPPEGFLIAEINGKVIGYVVGNMRNDFEGHILAIAVDPDYKKRGVGTKLMEAIINVLKDKGAARVRVELKLYNTDAKKFYSSLGFKESHIAKGYYRMRGYNEDALIMIKNLE